MDGPSGGLCASGFCLEAILRPELMENRKVFCVGFNKTGTTSLMKALKELGFKVGNQRTAEEMLVHYENGDFAPIIRYCASADAFQDVPFSLPNTFRHLHAGFPDSLFILTVRSSSEQWYQSLVRFHSKLFNNGETPTAEALRNATYVEKGWIWRFNRCLINSSEADPYEKGNAVRCYEQHNRDVTDFFKDRHQQLLVLNVSSPDAYAQLCQFLGKPELEGSFPWENSTDKK